MKRSFFSEDRIGSDGPSLEHKGLRYLKRSGLISVEIW